MWIYLAVYVFLILLYRYIRNKNLSNTAKLSLIRKIFLIMIFMVSVALASDMMQCQNSNGKDTVRLERQSYGEIGRKERLVAVIEGEEPQEIEVEVSPRKYNKKEVRKMSREVGKELDKQILGENRSFGHVDKPLKLPEYLEKFPFRIYWEFSRYDVIDMAGKLQKDAIRQVDPDGEGISVTLKGILSYEEQEFIYSREVMVYEPETEGKGIYQQLKEKVRALDKEQVEKDHLDLPKEIRGKKVRWEKETKFFLPEFFLYGTMISLCLFMVEKERRQKQYVNKKQNMLQDYPQIVSQFTLLMEAGMNAKNVWKKIVEDYEIRKKQTGRVRDAYEEMAYTYQEMRSGIPEVECYERFARRSDSAQYRKLGMLLAQNLKKGSRGVAQILCMESFQVMEEAKSRIRMSGEKAGTKLLGPMLMMLFVVMLIVVIPAFLSIQI